MKTWFSIKAKADKKVEVSVFDDIGAWGVTAKDFIAAIKPHAGQPLDVVINSPGGSVFDALAMYNALRSHGGEIHVRILGVAASAASLVAMAGDKITMPENTFLMIHNPWAFTAGNADELRDFADTLDTIASSLVKTYVARTGIAEDEIKELLAAETWMTAEEAVAKGFATDIEPALQVAAHYDADRLPETVKAAVISTTVTTTTWTDDEQEGETASDDPAASGTADINASEELPEEQGEPEDDHPLADEISAYAAKVGMADFAMAVALDTNVKNLDDAKARFALGREIQALCSVAGKPAMADALIRTGASLDAAREQITASLADAADRNQTSQAQRSTDQAPAGNVWAKIFPPAEQRK